MTGSTSQNSHRIRNRIRAEQRKRARKRRNSQGSPDASSGNDLASTSTIEGGTGGVPETALFERPRQSREDVRLCRMAIRKRWEPEAEETHAVMSKATRVALAETAHPQTVIAVAKLHLDAHRQIQSDEQNDDRLEFNDRVLAHKMLTSGGAVPLNLGVGVRINNQDAGADVSVLVYVPDNQRDPGGTRVGLPEFENPG